MKIKVLQESRISVLLVALLLGGAASAADIGDALRVLSLVERQAQQYGGIEVEPAKGIRGTSGHYLSPYTEEGSKTQWLDDILTAKEEKGAFECKKKSGSITVPMVGALMGAGGTKSCELKGMLKAAGGWEDIKDNSEVSFRKVEDMAVYLHALHHEEENYPEVLAVAMTLYPELEDKYQRTLSRAQIEALRASRGR